MSRSHLPGSVSSMHYRQLANYVTLIKDSLSLMIKIQQINNILRLYLCFSHLKISRNTRKTTNIISYWISHPLIIQKSCFQVILFEFQLKNKHGWLTETKTQLSWLKVAGLTKKEENFKSILTVTACNRKFWQYGKWAEVIATTNSQFDQSCQLLHLSALILDAVFVNSFYCNNLKICF